MADGLDAQLHALHWAFFSSVTDKDFSELFAEFVPWCDNLSNEEMDSILSDDDEETTTYTADEIWKSLSVN